MSPRLKILMLTGEYPPMLSGIGDYTHRLVQAIESANQAEVFVSTEWEKSRVIRMVREFQPHIFHFQYMTTVFNNDPAVNFFPGSLAGRFSKMAVVTTYHELAAPWGRLALLPLTLGSHAHIVTNERHFGILEKFRGLGLLRGVLEKIPLGPTITPCASAAGKRQEIRKKNGVMENEFLFVRFGIMHDVILPEILKLIDAFREARAHGMNVKLLLIGKAEPRALAALTPELSDWLLLEKDLKGEDISAHLGAADAAIALYPDGVSEKRTALFSLFAHGLPVIASQKGRLPSMFHDGGNMLCVPVGANSEKWMDGFRQVVQDPALRARLSEGGRKMAEAHDWSTIGAKTLALYQRVARK